LTGVCGPLQLAVDYRPFYIENYQIVYLSDPYKICNISEYAVRKLLTTNYFEGRTYENKTYNVFDDSWFGTKLLRQAFTSNFYVQSKEGFDSCGIGFIKQGEEDKVLDIAKALNLCCVVFREGWKEGFTPVRINKETKDYSQLIDVPNHLKVKDTNLNGRYTFVTGFRKWFYKMFRYEVKANFLNCMTGERAFLRWSWMPFLLPLCFDENNVSTNLLVQHIIYNYERVMHTAISLKFLIQIEKIHPIQLAGTTAILFGGHDITGKEMCYSNFKYVYKHSIKQWITQFDDEEPKERSKEIWKMLSYQNDWKYLNNKQKILLEVFMYSHEVLDWYNIVRKWKNNIKYIKNRELYFTDGKLNIITQLMNLMKFLDFG
jgi:hypothetical protein